jgi:dTDP-4-amino-4,6-dideoxygalactose transaminase
MNIPYASPNLRCGDIVRALAFSETDAEERIKQYFRQLTGKRHVLITNSCRTALFLVYCALEAKGEVITSPLTCKVAIDPIIESGNTPVFADISLTDLCIQPGDIANRITGSTIAIQAIHIGGVSCDMDCITDVAERNNLKVIEDCAQSLGANYKGRPCGTFGDVACFSLIKNAYGIGGGIMATNDTEIYISAQAMNDQFGTAARALTLYRVVRNLLDTRRSHRISSLLHRLLIKLRGGKAGYQSVTGQLKQVGDIEKKIVAHQMARWPVLHKQRALIGKRYCEQLAVAGIMDNRGFSADDSSFTKLFVYHPAISTQKLIRTLKKQGIEAMHLEQKHGSPVQKRLVRPARCSENGLGNYNNVHDHLISLPLFEQMSESGLTQIVTLMKRTMDT